MRVALAQVCPILIKVGDKLFRQVQGSIKQWVERFISSILFCFVLFWLTFTNACLKFNELFDELHIITAWQDYSSLKKIAMHFLLISGEIFILCASLHLCETTISFYFISLVHWLTAVM